MPGRAAEQERERENPADLLEAELFGIGRGVATGVSERPGRFQQANGGTLFLDEIGDMPAPLQAKLLRALQEREIQPVGGTPVRLDLRIISATNADIQSAIELGRFRRDLYYRLAGYLLSVPSLRERRDDVPALVEAFLRRFSQETGKHVRGVTARALQALSAHGWPGNVRELEHEVRRLVYVCPDGQPIDSTMLPSHIAAAGEAAVTTSAGPLDLDAQVRAVETRVIREALAQTGGNRSEAARLLGISRNGLALKLERLGGR